VAPGLRRLGVRPGRVLLVHVGYGPDIGFTDPPAALIAAFREVLGSEGTLCMMSMPFTGRTMREHLETPDLPPFDPRRSMSKVGVVTEVFRRQRGVLRSLHPTHPVCAQGPLAEALCAPTEPDEETPFGPGGFFGRLVAHDAQMLLFGVGFRRLTFEHFLEDRLAERLRFPVYDAAVPARVVRPDGSVGEVRVRPLSAELARRRRTWRLEWLLRVTRRLRSDRLGPVQVHLCEARPVLETVMRAAAFGWRFHR
jgi:aminoglycoside 3-N-acetyltransferase